MVNDTRPAKLLILLRGGTKNSNGSGVSREAPRGNFDHKFRAGWNSTLRRDLERYMIFLCRIQFVRDPREGLGDGGCVESLNVYVELSDHACCYQLLIERVDFSCDLCYTTGSGINI